MVFKVVTGIEKHLWQIYTSRFTSSEFVTAALDLTNQHLDHYKNRVLLNWGNFNPALVSFYSKGDYMQERGCMSRLDMNGKK